MSLTAFPSGLVPAYHPSGLIRSIAHQGILLPGTNVNIFKGQPVKVLIGTGATVNGVTIPAGQTYLAPCTAAADKIFGVFAGVEYFDATGFPQESNFWPASQTTFANTVITAFIWEDPLIEYTIQTDGTSSGVAVTPGLGDSYPRYDGRELNIVNFAAGSATVGLSQCAAGLSTLVATGTQGQLFITKTDPTILNQTQGDAFLQLQVRIANSQTATPFVSV
jgi:hypothetical protein